MHLTVIIAGNSLPPRSIEKNEMAHTIVIRAEYEVMSVTTYTKDDSL